MQKHPKVRPALLAYLLVFGVFVFIYATKAINGTATQYELITLGIAVFLLIIAAIRILREASKPDA
jgi:predicted tellurium resistance membrane protein TerC